MILDFHPAYDGTLSIQIDVQYKDVKALRLRRRPDGTLALSAPRGCPGKLISDFLTESESWIRETVRKTEEWRIRPGETAYLGKKLLLQVVTRENPAILLGNGSMVVGGGTRRRALAALDQWWRARLLEVVEPMTEHWFERLDLAEDGPLSRNEVRKMKARWASCAVGRRTVTYNYYLLCAPAPDIECVVLHELLHLRYPNHGRGFKAALSACMPDWKQRSQDLYESWSRYIGSQ